MSSPPLQQPPPINPFGPGPRTSPRSPGVTFALPSENHHHKRTRQILLRVCCIVMIYMIFFSCYYYVLYIVCAHISYYIHNNYNIFVRLEAITTPRPDNGIINTFIKCDIILNRVPKYSRVRLVAVR